MSTIREHASQLIGQRKSAIVLESDGQRLEDGQDFEILPGSIIFVTWSPLESHPLHVAAMYRNLPVIRRWIANGTLVDLRDGSGLTPSMCAVSMRQKEVLEQLLKYGADVNVRDSHGDTAEDLAKDFGHSKIANMLKTHTKR